MKIRKFDPIRDKKQLDEMYLSRDMQPIPDEALPSIGVIVDNVAAAFLYQADAGLSLIEGYISFANLHYKEREEALDMITDALCQKAADLGFKKVLGLTQSQSIYTRALRTGFNDLGDYRVISLSVNQSKFNKKVG